LGGTYFDLEQETERRRLDLSWDDVASGPALVLLDEAQSWPEIFPRPLGAIDEDRHRVGGRPGQAAREAAKDLLAGQRPAARAARRRQP
jgi:hypothetical protein